MTLFKYILTYIKDLARAVFCQFKALPLMLSVFLAVLGVGACAASSDNIVDKTNNANVSDQNSYLHLNTEKGAIVIQLYESAAPKTIGKLLELVHSPSKSKERNLYDQLEIDYTVPHVEIRTSTPKGLEKLKIPKEINAESLGLDKILIKTPAEAMNIWQFDILKYFRKHKKSGTASLTVKEWMKKWDAEKNANFLVGLSMKEINEAMDFSYSEGIVSHPVIKGSVMLKPVSNKESGSQLVIALSDIPTRTGKWVVIGKVVKGLETAEMISVLPNSDMKKPKYKPINPVNITQMEVKNTSKLD